MSIFVLLKFAHILGVILFLGDILVTAIWKNFADRTRNPAVVLFSQEMVIWTDKVLLIPGIALLLGSGYTHAGLLQIPIWSLSSYLWAHVFFGASGLIWAIVLIPLQRRQLHMAQEMQGRNEIMPEFYRLSDRWNLWGLFTILLPLGSVFLMIRR